MLGFVTGLALPAKGNCNIGSRICSQKPQHTAETRLRRSGCVMAAEKTQKKKKAPKAFALDGKGKPVWQLRVATPDDLDAILSLGGDVGLHGHSIISNLLNNSDCACVVCEANVKGTKEGEGYHGEILGCALSNINLRVKDLQVGFDSGLIKIGEVLAVTVSDALPNADEIERTLMLAALQKMKSMNVVQVTQSTLASDEEEIKWFKSQGFTILQNVEPETRGSKTQLTYLMAHLLAINPDPRKKFS